MSTKLSSQQWDWDVRVRERNLKAGILSEKEVEKMLTSLEDLTEKMDTVSLAQPAMASSASLPDDDDDDDEDDEVGGDGEGAEP
jgi:hypothetical protein